MKHNVIFLEGLPGSGKTTYCRRLAEYYKSKGIEVVQYNEGDLHPIDLAWCSYCTKEEFDEILKKYPLFKAEIKKQTIFENDHYITAYTRVNHPDIKADFFSDMERYEISKRKSKNDFLEVHIDRWKKFNQEFDAKKLYIFECIFLQNHITELILNYDINKEAAKKYFKKLIKQIRDTSPVVFYIKQENIKKTFHRIIEERRSPDKSKYKDWIDNVFIYLESTKYAKEKDFLGLEGMERFGEYRQNMELKVLRNIKVDYEVFKLDEDYDQIFDKMKKAQII